MRGQRTRVARASALALGIAIGAGLAGCARAGPPVSRVAAATPGLAVPLSTSLPSTGATWAVVPVAARSGQFWELLVERAGSSRWSLVTPPGVADNGGLVVSPRGGHSLVAGFRPSEDMVFSPLAATTDAGVTWSPGLLDASLANVPDALAATPDGRLLALLRGGEAKLSVPGGTRWTTLASARYAALLARYGERARVVAQACPGLVERVEQGMWDEAGTLTLVRRYVEPLVAAGADQIVLGCTHYPFLRNAIETVAGPAVEVLETGPAVAAELQRRLTVAGSLATGCTGGVGFLTSGDPASSLPVLMRLWGETVVLDAWERRG